MKKLSFNSTLNHKRDGYNTYEVSVEKVITICGDEFSKLKNFTLDDGAVFPIPTAVLTDEKYKALKEKYPQDITADCDKWLKLLNR